LVFGVFALAYANGSNDISKGIATLVGSGVTNYQRAILWGSAWTTGGSLVAAYFSQGLVVAFSRGIVDSRFQISSVFLIAVLIGSIGWVLFATKTGLPVSTTHAITGALCGAGVMAFGWQGILWASVSKKILVPLLISPLIALMASCILFPALRRIVTPLSKRCACAEARRVQLATAVGIVGTPATGETIPSMRLVVDHLDHCQTRSATIVGFRLDDALHWFSSGLTSFARGLSDAPKIVALGTTLTLFLTHDSSLLFVFVALAMGLGSLVAGTCVTKTLAEKITMMTPVEGLSANLITSFMVGFASRWGIPVSTTHVSSGAIIGLGLRRPGYSLQWKTVGSIVQAWVITLPAAGLLAGTSWLILDAFLP
jgi:PiT family inorganic phosphate transporter